MRGGIVRSFALAALLASGIPAHADRVDELTASLTSSSNDKARLAACVALAKLDDKRALKPLVGALADPSPQIRAVAAAGLGKLAHKAALPQLRHVAVDDLDETVRARARDAAIAIARANQLPDPFPVAAHARVAQQPPALKKGRPGFGNTPHAIVAHAAETYVRINSSTDDSPGRADKKSRQANAELLRNFLMNQFRANPQLTTLDADAEKRSLTARHLDLSVVKLDVVTSGPHVEVEAQLRLAISDKTGKMLSFVSGGAKLSVLKTKFNPKYLANLRRDALEGAMRGLYDKLVAQLQDRSQS